MKKYCPKCKKVRFLMGKFCEECGAELVEGKLCVCGKQMLDHYKFCPKCGINLLPSGGENE